MLTVRRANVADGGAESAEQRHMADSTAESAAEELNLKANSEFVDLVANRLKGLRRLRWSVPDSATVLRSSLGDVIQAPNSPLSWWVAMVELRRSGVWLPTYVGDEVDARLKPHLEWKPCCLLRSRLYASMRMVEMPLIQLAILVTLLHYQLHDVLDWSGGKMPLCIAEGEGVRVRAVEVGFNCALFYLGIMEMRQGGIEWTVIPFLSSLRVDPFANALLYICALSEQVCQVLYALNLYLLLEHTPDLIDCLLNCLALTFVMELCVPSPRQPERRDHWMPTRVYVRAAAGARTGTTWSSSSSRAFRRRRPMSSAS